MLKNKVAAFAKNRMGLETAIRYNPLFYGRIRRLLRSSQLMDTDARAAQSEALLKRTLAWARTSEYGRGQSDSLSDWPILDSCTIRAEPKTLLTGAMFSMPAASSGTSGRPVKLWRSCQCAAAEQAFHDHMFSPVIGRDLRTAKVAVMRADTVKDPSDHNPPFGRFSRSGRRLLLSSFHLSAQTAPWYAEQLKGFQPEVLWVYPSSAAALARHLQDIKPPPIPVILSSSETLTSSLRDRLASLFDATVIDYYGQAERVCLAVSVRPEEYRFVPLYGRVQLVPVEDETQPADVASAEILATGFWNHVMPLVRYRTGDLIQYPASFGAEELEKIASGDLPFLHVLGRSQDYLISPRGERLVGVNHLPWNLNHIVQMQVIQEDQSSVRIRIVPEKDFGETDHRKLRRNAGMLIPDNMSVQIELVEELERGPSGKIAFLIRNIRQSSETTPIN